MRRVSIVVVLLAVGTAAHASPPPSPPLLDPGIDPSELRAQVWPAAHWPLRGPVLTVEDAVGPCRAADVTPVACRVAAGDYRGAVDLLAATAERSADPYTPDAEIAAILLEHVDELGRPFIAELMTRVREPDVIAEAFVTRGDRGTAAWIANLARAHAGTREAACHRGFRAIWLGDLEDALATARRAWPTRECDGAFAADACARALDASWEQTGRGADVVIAVEAQCASNQLVLTPAFGDALTLQLWSTDPATPWLTWERISIRLIHREHALPTSVAIRAVSNELTAARCDRDVRDLVRGHIDDLRSTRELSVTEDAQVRSLEARAAACP